MIEATEQMGNSLFLASHPGVLIDWGNLSAEQRGVWMRRVQTILDLVPQPEEVELPATYLDGAVLNCSIDTENESGPQKVSLEVTFPLTTRYHKTPGSTRKILQKILTQAQIKGNVLRISTVDDARVKSEFSRIQDNGTLRELAPNEGIW